MEALHKPDAVTMPSTDTGHLHGAPKYSQLGKDAAWKLLKSTVDTWPTIEQELFWKVLLGIW